MKTNHLIVFGIISMLTLGIFGPLPQVYASTCHVVVKNTWSGCEPSVSTDGVISTDQYSAIVSASYNSNDAEYNTIDWPVLSIEYGIKGENLDSVSDSSFKMPKGTNSYSFLLNGLQDGQQYDFRAKLTWVGGVKYGAVKSFIAVKKQTGNGGAVTNTSTINTSSTGTDTGSSSTTTTSTTSSTNNGSGWLFTLLGGQKASTPAKQFINIDERNGLKLAIDDGITQVNTGDSVTLKVRYENNSTKDFPKSTIEIFLPPEFTFNSSSKGIFDRIDNILTITLQDFPAGAFGTATVDITASGKHGDLDQVVSQARLTAGTNVLKVADVDEYVVKKSTSLLGASASSTTGFLPSTIIGWILLLVVLALVVVIGRRYFIKKDY